MIRKKTKGDDKEKKKNVVLSKKKQMEHLRSTLQVDHIVRY